jgi:diguanylate cyclase (GGDEF)-like protein/PAS domain S-box-containing protein
VTRRGSLLVVDDNEPNRDALSRRLRSRGYTVGLAADGAEALAAIASTRFDLVLLDVEMPGMSGLDVLSQLRSRHSRTELPAIMVTARSAGEDVVEAFRLGANDYLTKPIDFPVAAARIETHLSLKWATADLRDSEERYALAVRGANDGLWDWNLVTNQVYWSPRWKAMLGYADTEIGADPDEWFSRVHPEDVGAVKEALATHLAHGSGHYESEHRLLHRDETFRWVRCRGAAVRNGDGVATRLAGSLTDITEAKLADALTGLPNRYLFLDLVERCIMRAVRRRDYVFGLFVIGLDRIKIIHDTLGPLAADRLLVAVAHRLQGSVRSTDIVTRDEPGFTLARLGGDEFTVLLDDITDANAAVRVAQRVRRALEEPFELEGHQVFTSATIGIAISTTGYKRPEEILRDAAIALHRATASGTLPYEIFDPEMRRQAMSRLQVETDLRNAIDSGAFELHYQPIVSLRTGQIAGFEALVRWQHPLRGLLSPAEFIPIAEDTGMIADIGRMTLAESCRQMAAWQARFGAAAPRMMCANVSTRQFADADLLKEIAAALDRAGLPASHLKLEITESAFINDVPAAQLTLNRARSLGVEWSLDDFGTGYSSLSYLHRLQVRTVKVDRSFVSGIGHAGSGSPMVSAIVALAHTLGMDVVAEGVETAEQYTQLKELGCEYAQGYFFSRPVDTATAGRLIEAQPWRLSLTGPTV